MDQTNSDKSTRLDSWKEIANYLQRSVRTVIRWEREESLPVHRHLHGKRGTIYANSSEIDAWKANRSLDTNHNGSRWATLPSGLNRKTIIRSGISLLMVVSLLTSWPSRSPDSSEPRTQAVNFGERDWVLITDFDNSTGEPIFDGVLEYALATEISDSQFSRVIQQQRIEDTLRLMKRPVDAPVDAELGREICLRDGQIQTMMTGEVEKVNSTYLLTVQLIDPTQGITLATTSQKAQNQNEVLPAIEELLNWVRQKMGETRTLVAGSRKEPIFLSRTEGIFHVSTTSLEALQLYRQAVSLSPPMGAAEKLLEQVVEIDPDFASAHIYLAHCISNQKRPADEYMPHAQRAFDLAKTVSEKERLFILGSYHQLKKEFQEAIQYYEALLDLDPLHFWANNNLRFAYQRLGQNDAVFGLNVQSADVRPNDIASNLRAVSDLVHQGQLFEAKFYNDRAKRLIDADVDQYRHSKSFQFTQAQLFPVSEAWIKGDPGRVLSELERVEQTFSKHFLFPFWASAYYLAIGKLATAEEILAHVDRKIGQSQLIWIELLRQDDEMLRQYLGESLSQSSRGGLFDILAARLGLLAENGPYVRKMSDYKSPTGFGELIWTFVRGELAMARGDRAAAIAMFQDGIDGFTLETLPPRPNPTLIFLGSESLARALEENGDTWEAVRSLEKLSNEKRKIQVAFQNPLLWIRNQFLLAKLYRKVGRIQRAEVIEDDLRNLLAYADPDHAIAQRLRSRQIARVH